MAEKSDDQIILHEDVISSKIYMIRGEKVMLDRDIAELYDVKAIRLREQLKRNLDIFPEHFMFQLTEPEVEIMVSQNAIPVNSSSFETRMRFWIQTSTNKKVTFKTKFYDTK